MADQSGWNAQQFVAQPGGVGAAVLIDAGQGLKQHRQVAGQQRGPHPHRVDGGVCRGQAAQAGPEHGLTDPVFDVGAAPEPGLDVADRLALLALLARVGLVVGGMLVTMKQTA